MRHFGCSLSSVLLKLFCDDPGGLHYGNPWLLWEPLPRRARPQVEKGRENTLGRQLSPRRRFGAQSHTLPEVVGAPSTRRSTPTVELTWSSSSRPNLGTRTREHGIARTRLGSWKQKNKLCYAARCAARTAGEIVVRNDANCKLASRYLPIYPSIPLSIYPSVCSQACRTSCKRSRNPIHRSVRNLLVTPVVPPHWSLGRPLGADAVLFATAWLGASASAAVSHARITPCFLGLAGFVAQVSL